VVEAGRGLGRVATLMNDGSFWSKKYVFSNMGCDIPWGLVVQQVQHPGEIPIKAGAAVKTVGHCVVLNRGRIQQHAAVETSAGGSIEKSDTGLHNRYRCGSTRRGRRTGRPRYLSKEVVPPDQIVPAANPFATAILFDITFNWS